MMSLKSSKAQTLVDSLEKIPVISESEIACYADSISRTTSNLLPTSLDPATVSNVLFGNNLKSLCRMDSSRTCAGCCDDFTQERDVLERKYRWRKKAYKEIVRDSSDFTLYKTQVRKKEVFSQKCPYVAFLDERERSVGCLLHPKNPANRGIDRRNYGIYGSGLCSAYVCSAIKTLEKAKLSDRLLILHIIESSDNWYYYSRLFSPSVTYGYHRGVIEIFLHCKEHV